MTLPRNRQPRSGHDILSASVHTTVHDCLAAPPFPKIDHQSDYHHSSAIIAIIIALIFTHRQPISRYDEFIFKPIKALLYDSIIKNIE